MARPLRLEFTGALYHVSSRGDRREPIYEDDEDRRRFLATLGEVVGQMHWVCYAYCLMSNHYHLLIETPDGNLAKGMRQLNGIYTQASNRRHKRVGHLFQGRYQAILVEGDVYLLELIRYVVLNPVRAGMVPHAGDWLWSSYGATVGSAERPSWLAVDGLLAQFGNRRAEARRRYAKFVAEGLDRPSVWNELKGQIFLGGEAFVKRMQARLGAVAEDVNIPRAQRRAPAPPLTVIERRFRHRDAAIIAAYATGDYSYQQIARHFSVHFTTVGRIVREARRRV